MATWLHGPWVASLLICLPALVPHVTSPATGLNQQSSSATASPALPIAGPSSGGGPTGKSYVVPPRPRPGRKPATDEPASKRKAQNRESQRNFRARKAAKVKELQDALKARQEEYEEAVNRRLAEITRLNDRVLELENTLQTQKNSMDVMRTEYAAMEANRNYWHEQYDRMVQEQEALTQQLPPQNPIVNRSHFANHQYQQKPVYETRMEDSASGANAYSTPNTDILDGCGGCKPNGECPCITDIANQATLEEDFEPAVPLPARPTPKKEATAQTSNVFSELEIDFTAQFSSQQIRSDPRTSISFMTDNEHESCGFCTDVSNCACRDSSLQVGGGVDDDTSAITADDKPAPRVLQGPGSCEDCQANPKQAAWCQRISKLRSEATPPISRRSSNASSSSRTSIVKPLRRDSNMSVSSRISNVSDSRMNNSLKTLEPRVDSHIDTNTNRALRSIGCSEAFKLLDGRVPMDADRMDWVANLKPVSHDARRDTFTMEPRLYSAMELDAAGIITTLGNSRQTLQPRPSDGKNADIVRLAEEFRRNSNSPRTAPEDQKPVSVEPMHMEM